MLELTLKRKFYVLLLVGIIGCFLLIWPHHSLINDVDRELRLAKIDIFIKQQANSLACKQPDLELYNPEMLQFIKKVPPINCDKAGDDWVKCRGSECVIQELAKKNHGPINCAFTDVIRVDDYELTDGETFYSSEYYKLERSDVVRVACQSSDSRKWSATLTGVRLDNNIWDKTNWEQMKKTALNMNVLMFGYDSLSRNAFIRKLPESYEYLTKVLNAVVLKGYNIVGDGTPQALIPLLTGRTELELPDTRKRLKNTNYVNSYPFIWNEYKNAGYVTAFLEDVPHIGTFTYRLNGFKQVPTDHYMRPYYLANHDEQHKWAKLCTGDSPRHQIMLNYIKDFFSVYQTKPKFLFGFHGELSHDDYNLIEVADHDTMNLLKDLKESGALNNTILIIMADHGHRFADVRNTIQGKQEERLPFFAFAFPEWFAHQYPRAYRNFRKNSDKLTTPFDVHRTLQEVLDLKNTGFGNLNQRSISLFSEIPAARSCAHAYIEPHWCACLAWEKISLSHPIIPRLGDTLLNFINNLTDSKRYMCEELKLAKVSWAMKLTPNRNLVKFSQNKDIDGFVADLSANTHITEELYQIKVTLVPGKLIDALKLVLTKAPLGTKNQQIKYAPLPTSKRETKEPAVQPGWKCYSVAIKLWLVSLALLGSLYLLEVFSLKSLPKTALNALSGLHKPPEIGSKSLHGYLVNTPGCRIPDMDPFDSAIREFIFSPPEQKCLKVPPALFYSTPTELHMNLPVLRQFHQLKNSSELRCCYQEFSRQDPSGSSADVQVAYSEQCVELGKSATAIQSEFIKVTCTTNSKGKIYEDYFAFVPKAPKKTNPAVELKPNVLIIGLDAISRVNLHRQLPKSYEFLMKKLQGVELLGYNKVADNTFPNLIPVLTGLFEKELKPLCWPTFSTHFDRCPFVWKNYSQKGYATAIGEDCAWIGLFNYLKVGFKNRPSDYYYTTFSKQLESKIGYNGDMNCAQCVGSRLSYSVTLDYIKKFVWRMSRDRSPYFGFFWSNSLSHDYLNRPASGDGKIMELLVHLEEEGGLNNTVLILMSDHGIRWGDIRQTYQGQMEERLPFVILALPQWFRLRYAQAVANLNANVRRLTTPFDLHETLKDLLDARGLESPNLALNELKRGYSLFARIPKTRTCQEAEIESHWCTCQESRAVPPNNAQVVKAANFAVVTMNQFLKGYAQCASLTLEKIISARLMAYDAKHITRKKSIRDYRLTLRTLPGAGVFEVTVRLKDFFENPTDKN
ncbi:hypothetical protein YQE_07164, partial [Dendroctonus ponderosae]